MAGWRTSTVCVGFAPAMPTKQSANTRTRPRAAASASETTLDVIEPSVHLTVTTALPLLGAVGASRQSAHP